MILGNAIVVLGTVILALFPENYDLIKVGLIVRGLGIAPTAVASYAMLGDVADYGEWKTGIRSDGLIFSAGTFGEKSWFRVRRIIDWYCNVNWRVCCWSCCSNTRYDFAIKALFAYIPILLGVISIVLMFFYDLDKKLPEIVKIFKNVLKDYQNNKIYGEMPSAFS